VLAKQELYHQNHTLAHFAYVTFEIGSEFILRQAWIFIPFIYASHVPGMTGTSHHTQLLLVKCGLESSLIRLASNGDPPILQLGSEA
jgi:hypothetical protein